MRTCADWGSDPRDLSRCSEYGRMNSFSVTMVRATHLLLYPSVTNSSTEYGMYVDKRGAPSRTPPTIEWEGVARHAAWHAPYVLLFCTAFIEVRHVESGRLAQVISGQDNSCLWDGRGVVHHEGPDAFDDPRTPRIHAVLDDPGTSMSMAARAHSHSPPRRQCVVVLAPTERLVVPGTRYSPSLLSVADTLPPYVP